MYYWSMDRADLSRLNADSGWFGFLEGRDPTYPEIALQADFARLRAQMEKVRRDPTTPDTRLSDNPNPFNPAIPGGLTQLMLGGLTPRHGSPLHCRVRYFDPQAGRAGMPEGVGALVERLGRGLHDADAGKHRSSGRARSNRARRSLCRAPVYERARGREGNDDR